MQILKYLAYMAAAALMVGACFYNVSNGSWIMAGVGAIGAAAWFYCAILVVRDES